MKLPVIVAALALLVFAGCETRSISDSGYSSPSFWEGGRTSSPMYRGELTEFDILGVAPSTDATQANIAEALATASSPRLKRGDKVLLIQSGAMVPDNEMMAAISPYFDVAPFSGVPYFDGSPLSNVSQADKDRVAASLRLRAAQGGFHYLVCYWGVLESAQEDQSGKVVSWVPILGRFVTDQKQQMRIRLKAILVDVATGHWRMLTPEVHSDENLNAGWNRADRDQKLVIALKEKGYRSLVDNLLL